MLKMLQFVKWFCFKTAIPDSWFNSEEKKKEEKPRSQTYRVKNCSTLVPECPLQDSTLTGKEKWCRHLLRSGHLERSKRGQKYSYAHILTFCVVLSERL